MASLFEQVADDLLHNFAPDLGNGAGKRNVLGADLDAVLRIATFLNATVAHQGGQTLPLKGGSRGMRIEQANLGNRGRADEAGILVELRTSLHAGAARNAARERIGNFLILHSYARARAEGIA